MLKLTERTQPFGSGIEKNLNSVWLLCGFFYINATKKKSKTFPMIVTRNKQSLSRVRGAPAGMREAGVNLNC